MVAPQALPEQRLTVLYGSQTGNARRQAEHIAEAAKAAGHSVRLLRTDAYATRELGGERLLYLVISTQGEGDPPDDSIGFTEFCSASARRSCRNCATRCWGWAIPAMPISAASPASWTRGWPNLARSACRTPALPTSTSTRWPRRGAMPLLRAGELLKASTPAAHLATVTPLRPASAWSAERPFRAEVLANQRITGRAFRSVGFRRYRDDGPDVRHVELSLEGSGIAYEPGDALGIRHRNPPSLVEAVLQATRLDGDADVAIDGEARPLSEWLAARRELTRLSRPFLAALAERSAAADLHTLLQPGEAGFAALLADHQIVDALRRWDGQWDAQALLAALRPQAQRLYPSPPAASVSARKRILSSTWSATRRMATRTLVPPAASSPRWKKAATCRSTSSRTSASASPPMPAATSS